MVGKPILVILQLCNVRSREEQNNRSNSGGPIRAITRHERGFCQELVNLNTNAVNVQYHAGLAMEVSFVMTPVSPLYNHHPLSLHPTPSI